jgi:hypothetical protein
MQSKWKDGNYVLLHSFFCYIKKKHNNPLFVKQTMKFIFIFTQNKKDTTNLHSLEIESIFIMKIFISKKIHPHYQISGINGFELSTQFNSIQCY